MKTKLDQLLREYAAAEQAVVDAEARRAAAWQDIINSLPADEAVELLERKTV
jgi:hypothetical protein